MDKLIFFAVEVHDIESGETFVRDLVKKPRDFTLEDYLALRDDDEWREMAERGDVRLIPITGKE